MQTTRKTGEKMSNLKKLNEEFEKAIQAQIQERLEERDGQVVVVRRFPSAISLPKELFWQRADELRGEEIKRLNRERPQGQGVSRKEAK